MIETARKWLFGVLTSLPLGGLGWALTSCDDFFSQESTDVLYADQEHLNSVVDTTYSVAGILTKLQVLADRTVLLGELRGDLVDLTNEAASDLRDVANFNIGDDNVYNAPSDYYAVINNCNYFIAHVDTALKSRNEPVFMAEYAAVKSIRAWTYLQLVLNYGRVPFVTEALLNREDAENAETGNTATLEDVCTYFINDLADLPERYNTEYPMGGLGIAGVTERSQLFFPLSLMRAELYLWRASATGSVSDYRQSAQHYYKFISEYRGRNIAYPTGTDTRSWPAGTTSFNSFSARGSLFPISTSFRDELITLIACNSSAVNGTYSQLRNLYVSRNENNNKVSIIPSQRMFDISEAQEYCLPDRNGKTFTYVTKGLSDYMSGDLRLSNVYSKGYSYDKYTEERIETQSIRKFNSANVYIYRRMMVYLHMAEAFNGAGFPRMAYLILSEGLSNKKIRSDVLPYYNDADDKTDSIFLAQFNFADTRYLVTTINDIVGTGTTSSPNQIGIHSRGCGWTPENAYYQFPDSVMVDSVNYAVPVARQQEYVDSLLLNEEALELAFEGTRYYDLMRFAMRQPNPGSFMAKHIYARRGEKEAAATQADIKANFSNRSDWYLHWNGKIGY